MLLKMLSINKWLNETLIFANFLRKKCRLIFLAQGQTSSPGKNRGKRIGENEGVQWFSLFYSSLGAGYAPRDVRRQIKI
jgi:hypothetical protein